MRVLRKAFEGISFLEILMDETLCDGDLWIASECVREAGGINHRLQAKKKYELVLRIAKNTPVIFVEEPDDLEIYELINDESEAEKDVSGWKTDCYVAAKYSEDLQNSQCMNLVLSSILAEAEQAGRYQQTVDYLEQMMGRMELFYHIDEATKPILIYKGDDVCHNILTIFAEQFGEALQRKGKKVIYFDVAQEEIAAIAQFVGQRFQAIIGVQTYLFGLKMKGGSQYVHELIYGPKFNFQFDHPIWAKNYLSPAIDNYHVLTLDWDYASFVQRYYKKRAFFFPPAGMRGDYTQENERIYDMTFVGTYGQYRMELTYIRNMERKQRFLANRFLLIMRKHPNISAEMALRNTLAYYGIELSDDDFVQLFYDLRRVIYCVMHYYREKIVRILLESGLTLDVFGASWKNSPLCEYTNLICHPDITVEESLLVWRKSKVSLNIMSWHKAGFTERMANIMLAGAVLVTDNTRYIQTSYNEDEMIAFELDSIQTLPCRIRSILDNPIKCQEIAKKGQQRAENEHVWTRRADALEELLFIK